MRRDIASSAESESKLKNDAQAAKSSNTGKDSSNKQTYDPLVIAQVVACVRYSQSSQKLSVLTRLYDQRVQRLDSDWIGAKIHPTRFKEHPFINYGVFSRRAQMYISPIRKQLEKLWLRVFAFKALKKIDKKL